MLFVAAALVASAYGGTMPGVAALVLGLLLADFFFIGIRGLAKTFHSFGTPQLFRYVFTASVGMILIEILRRNQLRTRAAVEALRSEVTRRKTSEERLADSQAQLSRHAEELERRVTERTAELEGLLYHIAHNLRAPLRAMEGFATLLAENYACTLDTTGQEYTQRICNAATRMDVLIRNLLDFGRLSHIEVNLHPTNLNFTMERVLHGVAYQIQTKAAEVVVSGPLPQVWAIESLAEQVLFNLLENALKFVAPGRKPRIQILAEEHEAAVRVWVQDNGIGVEPQYRDRIFGVFEQLHGEVYEGTGIGLAIVRQSMHRMRGQVGIESNQDGGSRFWVEFPVCPKPG